jgi:catechol 2,3-dioxygenase-like lactoylglutathione lyase family enzyme
MLKNHPIMAFVATAQPDRARAFYGSVLGLPLLEDQPWAMVFDAHGTSLRVQKTDHVATPGYTVLGWSVPDIAATMAGLRSAGVSFERYGFMPQDEDGVWTAPGGAKVAWFKDPDGNTLSLTQLETV